uniref:(California timema) hypothetical protein n=1 Tax=Timema californicum TaxID=61474 RepID=A0A7R9IXS3_TIMCA|nr:unnamed protein product [Timema californicum]
MRDHSQSNAESSVFEFSMGALTALLRRQSEQNPSASYFNVDILKYRIKSKVGAGSCPFQLVAYWKCEQSHTDLKVDYKYNSHAMASPSPLLNLTIAVPNEEVLSVVARDKVSQEEMSVLVYYGDLLLLSISFLDKVFHIIELGPQLFASALSGGYTKVLLIGQTECSSMERPICGSCEGPGWELASTGGGLSGSSALAAAGSTQTAASLSTGRTKWACRKQLAITAGLTALQLATIPSMALNMLSHAYPMLGISFVTASGLWWESYVTPKDATPAPYVIPKGAAPAPCVIPKGAAPAPCVIPKCAALLDLVRESIYVMGILIQNIANGKIKERLFTEDPMTLTFSKAKDIAEQVVANSELFTNIIGVKIKEEPEIIKVVESRAQGTSQKLSVRPPCKYMITTSGEHSQFQLFNMIVENQGTPLVLATVKLQNKYFSGEIDSGATFTAIAKSMYMESFSEKPLRQTNQTLRYSQHIVKPLGCCFIEVMYKQKTSVIEFHVVPEGGPLLLVRDFMKTFGFEVSNTSHDI